MALVLEKLQQRYKKLRSASENAKISKKFQSYALL